MGGQNWMVNPMTRDYVLNQGSPVPTDRIYEKAFFMLLIPQNQWLYADDQQGSKVNQLANAKRGSNVEQLFSTYVDDAIQTQLIDTGQATDVNTTNIEVSRNGTSNEIDIVPVDQPTTGQAQFIPL
jgi:phage gp46-like protein